MKMMSMILIVWYVIRECKAIHYLEMNYQEDLRIKAVNDKAVQETTPVN